jgi:hypothetical protein
MYSFTINVGSNTEILQYVRKSKYSLQIEIYYLHTYTLSFTINVHLSTEIFHYVRSIKLFTSD